MRHPKPRRHLLTATALLSAAIAMPAAAALNGHNVVLVHGFQPDNIFNPPDSFNEIRNNGANYWADFWASRADARVDWSSTDRVEGKIAQVAFEQFKDISRRGICNTGCVFVTHSTGDLVTRYMLENQDRWLQAQGLQPLKVTAVVDLAGAGGGTELADIGMSVAYNDSWYMAPLKEAFRAAFGFKPTPERMGVVNDLQPNVARNTAIEPNSIPRLRIAAGGSPYLGVTKPFIEGKDDGVVPLHSACGSVRADGVDSCVSHIRLSGKLASADAPDNLYFNHFPVLMTENGKHNGILGSQSGTSAVPVINNTALNGLRVQFASRTYEDKPWWQWWGSGDRFIEVPGAESTHTSALVYNALD